MIYYPGFCPLRSSVIDFGYGKLPFGKPFAAYRDSVFSLTEIKNTAVGIRLKTVIPYTVFRNFKIEKKNAVLRFTHLVSVTAVVFSQNKTNPLDPEVRVKRKFDVIFFTDDSRAVRFFMN